MARIAITVALLLTAWFPARSADVPTMPAAADFSGSWRIARVVGASEGGVTGADSKAMLGKTVHWTATAIRAPAGNCPLRDAHVKLVSNHMLETSLWGGQAIDQLDLSKTEIAKAFGGQQTPVFQDGGGCAHAVMIDRNHIVDAFGSGWIYRLDRVGR